MKAVHKNRRVKLTITILTDKKSWFMRYNHVLASKLRNEGHDVQVITSANCLRKGDVAFFLSCFEIIKGDCLKKNRYNIVVHESNLPKGRGWSPMTWQILEGKSDIPIVLFEARESVDSGPIYLKDIMHLDGTELISEWQEIQGRKTIDMCCDFVRQVSLNKQHPIEQEGVPSFYLRRTPADSRLDVKKTIEEQFNLFRVVDNERYPAFFELNNRRYYLKIYKEVPSQKES